MGSRPILGNVLKVFGRFVDYPRSAEIPKATLLNNCVE